MVGTRAGSDGYRPRWTRPVCQQRSTTEHTTSSTGHPHCFSAPLWLHSPGPHISYMWRPGWARRVPTPLASAGAPTTHCSSTQRPLTGRPPAAILAADRQQLGHQLTVRAGAGPPAPSPVRAVRLPARQWGSPPGTQTRRRPPIAGQQPPNLLSWQAALLAGRLPSGRARCPASARAAV